MATHRYAPVKMGTMPYGSLKVCGAPLREGETIYVPDSPSPGETPRAWRSPPNKPRLGYHGRICGATVDRVTEHCLFLSWR
jgi:hypothetical protein